MPRNEVTYLLDTSVAFRKLTYTDNTGCFFYRCPEHRSYQEMSGGCRFSMRQSCPAQGNDNRNSSCESQIMKLSRSDVTTSFQTKIIGSCSELIKTRGGAHGKT